MSGELRQGLVSGLQTGPFTGLNAEGVRKLLEASWHTPKVQSFSATSAALKSQMGGGDLGLASHIWLCDEASGNLVDEVGGISMSAVGTPLYDRRAAGLWDGVSAFNKKAVETAEEVNEGFATASALLDLTQSFAILGVVRIGVIPSAGSGANRTIVEQRDASFGAGFEIRIDASGNLELLVEDGTGTTALTSLVANFGDGAAHCFLAVVDLNAGTAALYTDVGSDSVALPGGSLASSAVFRMGGGGNRPAPRAQFCYLAAWKGAAAEGMGQTHLDNFWKAFQDPSGKLTTYSRASLFSDIVGQDGDGQDVIAHYSGEPSTPQVALGWSSGRSEGQGFGLANWGEAITNHCVNSEDIAGGWTLSGTGSVTANDADAPDKFRAADLLTPGGVGDFLWEHASSLTESTQYTISGWIRADTAHDANIQITDAAGSNSALVTHVESVTTKWKRFSFQATTEAGQTAARIKVYPDPTNGTDGIHLWGVQVNKGGFAKPYVRTSGAVASTVAIKPTFTVSAEDRIKGEKGEVLCLFDSPAPDAIVHFLVTARDSAGGGNTDRRDLRLQTGPRWVGWDSAASLAFDANDTGHDTSQHEFRCQWDESGDVLGSGNSGRLLEDGTELVKDGASFTSGDAVDVIEIGHNGLGGSCFGWMQKFSVYDRPRAA